MQQWGHFASPLTMAQDVLIIPLQELAATMTPPFLPWQ